MHQVVEATTAGKVENSVQAPSSDRCQPRELIVLILTGPAKNIISFEHIFYNLLYMYWRPGVYR